MNDTIYVALIGGVSGFVTGAVGSLIAPWVQWGVEKRRKKMDNRRNLLYDARRMLDGRAMKRDEYRESREYGAISSHLSKPLRDRIEQRNTTGGEELIRDDMYKELSELEKQWGLA